MAQRVTRLYVRNTNRRVSVSARVFITRQSRYLMYRVIALRSRSHVLSRSTPSIIKKTLLAARVSTSQTNSINGNAETVDSSYPTVTREIETDIAAQSEIINNISPESIPSSGALVPPPLLDALPAGSTTDWSRSYHGLSTQPFPPEVADILLASIDPLDIEMKPGTSFVRYPDCRCR